MDVRVRVVPWKLNGCLGTIEWSIRELGAVGLEQGV